MGALRSTWNCAWCAFLSSLWMMCVASASGGSAVQPNDGNYESIMKICDVQGCECTWMASWQVINCTFDTRQDVRIQRGTIVNNTIELHIKGGNQLIIDALSFHNLEAFMLLKIDGTRVVVINEQAFDSIKTSSVLDVQVSGCSYLLFERLAFTNMFTSIRAEISRCHLVEVRYGAFGRLQEAHFRHIVELDLKEGAFLFHNQSKPGRHGVVTNISFHYVTIPKIPARAFASTLSSIDIRDCSIEEIAMNGFAAYDTSAILAVNSHIGKVRSGAIGAHSLINFFLLRNCTVDLIETRSICAAIINFTIEFSSIKEIESKAVDIPATANIIISNNKLMQLRASSLMFSNWNNVQIESNIIERLESNSFLVPYNPEIVSFSFSSNEIHHAAENAFASIPELQRHLMHFRFYDNSFNEFCRCPFTEWLSALMNDSYVDYVLNASYCKVSAIIGKCFKIEQTLINMRNFSELVCGPEANITCERYQGVRKQIAETTIVSPNESSTDSSTRLLLIIVPSLVAVAVLGTVVILLVRGSVWLKRKGYCMRYEYEANDAPSNEDEGGMVAEGQRFDYPPLTNELLQELREQLESPETHDKAREMIEILYERFVIEESYIANNNRDEEAHLYEELGNMQHPAHHHHHHDCLKVMEEKINVPLIDEQPQFAVNQQYSEPLDAAVHLYSELKTHHSRPQEKEAGKRTSSANTLRPLPEKPRGEPGPSTMY